MNYGYQNEKNFVDLFNDKIFYELDNNSQKFLRTLSTMVSLSYAKAYIVY